MKAKHPEYLQDLVQTFLSIKSKDEMNDFLRGILTPHELEDIPVRLQIVKKLKQGTPQKKIAEELNVGIATITRGSTELKRGRFKALNESEEQ